jgi:dienelactone hydrolase
VFTAAGPRITAAILAAIGIALAVWQLEGYRHGVSVTRLDVAGTPATVFRRTGGGDAPAVVIAHGFAGSQQLMQAYALTLAEAGYVAVTFDFEGHGLNPRPMSGDVTKVTGTTEILMREVGRVVDAALRLPGVDGRIAVLGHSMASDIIVRQAIADPRISATIAVSMFSEAVTATQPRNLLMIAGAWEDHLRREAVRALQLSPAGGQEGVTSGNPADGTGRRAVAAPAVEHVGVLYSQTALRETRAWLDATFARAPGGNGVAATGGWIILLLFSIVLVTWPLSTLLPESPAQATSLPLQPFLLAVLVPPVLTPPLLSLVDTQWLPVMVADYLAAHLLLFGVISLALLASAGIKPGRLQFGPALLLIVLGLVVFGGALDRYVASFTPHAGRLPIIGAICLGAIPYLLADSLVTEAGRAPLWRVLLARGAFLGSLGAAVALDFERLFFLLIILPVIVLYFLIFGTMGGIVGRRSGSATAVGVGLGIILAWALGVTFPLFDAA